MKSHIYQFICFIACCNMYTCLAVDEVELKELLNGLETSFSSKLGVTNLKLRKMEKALTVEKKARQHLEMMLDQMSRVVTNITDAGAVKTLGRITNSWSQLESMCGDRKMVKKKENTFTEKTGKDGSFRTGRERRHVYGLPTKNNLDRLTRGLLIEKRLRAEMHTIVRNHEEELERLRQNFTYAMEAMEGLASDFAMHKKTSAKHYFSAGATATSFLPKLSKVVFNRVWANSGHYSSTTGVFTAPEDGTYTFFYHCLTDSNKEIWLELIHGWSYVNSIFARSGDFDTGSNSAIRVMRSGEHVYIRARRNSTIYGASDDVYCTFQGLQLS